MVKMAVCRLMLASPNCPALDAQRTFNHQTAAVLRGAYFQPGSRARSACERPCGALAPPGALTRDPGRDSGRIPK